MKNFLEATDIRSKLSCLLTIKFEPVGNNIPCRVLLNQEHVLLDQIINETTIIEEVIDLNQSIDLQIKIKREHPQAVVVSIDVDGYEIMPTHLHVANPPTNYIDFETGWTISIDNFYQWLHEREGLGWIA